MAGEGGEREGMHTCTWGGGREGGREGGTVYVHVHARTYVYMHTYIRTCTCTYTCMFLSHGGCCVEEFDVVMYSCAHVCFLSLFSSSVHCGVLYTCTYVHVSDYVSVHI